MSVNNNFFKFLLKKVILPYVYAPTFMCTYGSGTDVCTEYMSQISGTDTYSEHTGQ